MKVSARNQLEGRISAIEVGAVSCEVEVRLGNGDLLVATVSKSGVDKLGLVQGTPVVALIKAASILLMVGSGALVSARNQLLGVVSALADGEVTSEISVSLQGGVEMVATVTLASRRKLGLELGSEVSVIVKASSVILAVGN